MTKKILTFLFLVAICFGAKAQSTFTDNFDSYTAGSPLGPQSPNWTTWSGTQGGADDINVSTANPHSGANSLFFTSTSASGGPSDIVLPFGGPYNTGTLSFSAWFKVDAGKKGYFNFQGNTAVGGVYAINCFMLANGTLEISDNSNVLFLGTYPNGSWYQLTIDANLSANNWDVKINGTSIGSFSNSTFQVASIDIYPSDNSNSFYVDDVAYNYTAPTALATDLSNVILNVPNGLSGQVQMPNLVVRNLGTTPITSFDINVNQNGTNHNQSITGVNIASLATYTVTLSAPLTLAAGANLFTSTISNINGGASNDMDVSNNVKTYTITPVDPAPNKIVVAEEGTGTWCQWCPRGAVYMDLMSKKYDGYFQGIAVHNNDPMTVKGYDSVMGMHITGYPTALVDRLAGLDPSSMEPDFITRIQIAPKAILVNGAQYNSSTGKLDVSIQTTFQSAVTGNYAIACVLVEDSVKGTSASYNQSNAYAGGGSGVMGGFETKSNPVPASQMKYDHVARTISPGWGGVQNAYGTSAASGQVFIHSFSFTVDPSWHYNKIKIVGLLVAPDNKIDNASSSSIDKAISNGYLGTPDAINDFVITPLAMQLFPNPSDNSTNLMLNLTHTSEVSLALYSITGALVVAKNYGQLSGLNNLPIELKALPTGIYSLKVTVDGKPSTLKIVKN